MALQSQTYANSGNAYYIQGADPVNPSTNTALYGPVEILFTSTIAGAYHGTLNQTPSTFTISENNANLSTINSLVMDPVVPKTTMNVYNVNNTSDEPVIQQWSHTSSIVNGTFKVGNKQLNDEPNALIFQNGVPQSGITRIDQGTTQTFIDGVNNRTRFTNQADNTWNVSINQNPADASVSVNSPGPISIITQPSVQTFNRNNTTYGRIGVNSGGVNQYYMSARTQIDFVTDEVAVAPTVLSLKQDATANFISTVYAPTVSSITTTTTKARIQSQPAPNTYKAPADNEAQLQQGVIGGGGLLPDPPPTATNSLEIVASSALTEGGVQFYNAKSGTTPEWMGGFLKNPKSFNVAPAYTANLYGGVSTTTLFANTAVSTPVVRVSNFINVNESGYINVGSNGYISTPTVNATSSITTNYLTATSSMKSAIVTVTNNNSSQFALYPNQYGNFQGQMIYNTLRDNRGAPATAYESLEIVNVSGGPQTGGIQFYTSDNSNPNFPKWMGGFLQNNVGAGQSEFRLASTVTASMPQLVNVSTINTLPIASYGVPVGTMLNWAGQSASTVPAGYLLCDGSYVNIAGIYNNLFVTIGSWGPTIGGQFRLPDSRGKTLLGSVTLPVNSGPAGAYTITANMVSLVTVTLPSSWGGGTRLCLYITNPTGQIFPGMHVVTAGFDLNVFVQGFINSDGLYGNTSPVTPPGVNNRGVIVIFTANQSYSGPSNVPVQFQTNDGDAINYPYIQDSWNPLIPGFGVGNYAQLQQEYEVGAHQHIQQQGGLQGQAGLGPRCGDPNVGGPNTNTNGGIFSYIDPTTSQTVSGPFAMFNLPYNIATFQIIKY